MKVTGKDGWTARLERYPLVLTAVAAAISLGATAGMTIAAGPAAVLARVEDLVPVWLAVMVGARLLSYVGYALAHRRVTAARGRQELEAQTAARVVAFGAGATSLKGGFSIDRRALRGAGASDRQARSHVAALALLEYATLALGAWICSLLLLGEPGVQAQAVWPWAIGVPAGVLLAALAAPRLRARVHTGKAGDRLSGVVRGAEILAGQWRRPGRALAALFGMVVYWAAEAGALWAALRAFGVSCAPSVAILGYATGYVLTPRGLPLAGAGIAEVLLPVSLMWLGVPLAAAVPAALAAELARLAVSFPLAAVSKDEVHRLVGLHARGRRRTGRRRSAPVARG
jgi:uncharacterized membrane protein YbhN (UPF0104 family)